MRLGLLGGSFDPVHCGHVAVARAALASGLDRVILIPARRPPHKAGESLASPFDRFALVALATAGEPRLSVSPVEVSRDGPSYTIDTVRKFLAEGHVVTLIMGTDSLADLETWRDVDEILDRAAILAYPRRPWIGPGLTDRLPPAIRARLSAGPGAPGTVGLIDGPPEDVSSSLIRGRLGEGLGCGDLLPPLVADYIAKQGLYGPERTAR